jgi:ArsR family transcriptional regulator
MKELEQCFKALADANRLRILNLLLHGELCVCDIQFVLEASQPTVSRHLAYLKNSGIVLDRRDGLRIFYRLTEAKQGSMKRLFEFLRDAYKSEEQLQEDTRRLRDAIQEGSCTVPGTLPLLPVRRAHRASRWLRRSRSRLLWGAAGLDRARATRAMG